ncbi:unnamed protein product [Urochloa decumbens]|uniref:Uncharacterized protein n=1 Tax=Urochloa decumbens TaxID=240449 RepID=A0ABC9F2T3_9POAL
MGEAPCVAVVPRVRAATAAAHYSFRLPRHGRRKVHVVRLGGVGRGAPAARRGFRLRRWLRRAVWRLAELCVAALSGPQPAGAPPASAHPPWTGVEPFFAAPFVPVARMKRPAGAQA